MDILNFERALPAHSVLLFIQLTICLTRRGPRSHRSNVFPLSRAFFPHIKHYFIKGIISGRRTTSRNADPTTNSEPTRTFVFLKNGFKNWFIIIIIIIITIIIIIIIIIIVIVIVIIIIVIVIIIIIIIINNSNNNNNININNKLILLAIFRLWWQ